MLQSSSALLDFEARLKAEADPIAALRAGLIGDDLILDTPTGPKKMIYADYVASGRALHQVEDAILQDVLPYYANSHTEQSLCGARMTRLREDARSVVLRHVNGDKAEHAVIFGGSGATTGLNQAVHLFGIKDALARGECVHVLVGPYEHHSNLLPWRESGAEIVEIDEGPEGGIDLQHLETVCEELSGTGLLVAAFSAASNVTGVCTDPAPVTKIVKSFGGCIIWDYAAGAPYLPMSMAPDGAQIDALVLSPHKFIGGPGASGVLIMRRDAVRNTLPNRPGGGTVRFVNANAHDYVASLEQREEGGTPNIIGDIRAAMAILAKETIGTDTIGEINQRLIKRGLDEFRRIPGAELLGRQTPRGLPIFSFAPRKPDRSLIDYKKFTYALSSQYGIQARGGCSCAGPYVHRLLDISDQQSELLRQEFRDGNEGNKPGFVRFNLSYLMDEAKIAAIFAAISELLKKDL
ncbi:aminotransferase class V-fold PLP-dependent enzyme [Cognatishimia maritima]|uniref:Selenocysteine lyase/Cysteine desulfurase n=1 Tax=Cognatishimia maritima TaxID=870908 RepID=A0A1M5UB18_9RHOB|nr:aminotransferase class V-fold PLP-dependent enzyme [Cognatishimia maritima]SHH60167.1 Selenocysteine lyase/Cysteine desulfurase [Cognatishimia maritima]